MPFLFLVIGILFLTAAVRGKDQTDKLIGLIKSDFTGPNNFFVWMLAIGGLAGIGVIPKMKPFSNALLGLIFAVLIIGKKGKDGKDFFSSFISQVQGQ